MEGHDGVGGGANGDGRCERGWEVVMGLPAHSTSEGGDGGMLSCCEEQERVGNTKARGAVWQSVSGR